MKRRLIWAGAVKSVQEASIKRFEANNPEYVFLAETFPDGNSRVKASDLYNSYVEWSKNTGVSPKKLRKFSEAIQGMGCQRSAKTDGCFFYSIPSMAQFDPIGYLGLKKKIKNFIPEVLSPQSSLLSLSQSQQAIQVRDDCFSIIPETSTIPELSTKCDNKLPKEEITNQSLEAITPNSRENTPFRDDSGTIEKQSSLTSNPLPERDRDSRDDLGGKTSVINLEFPSLGCEVSNVDQSIHHLPEAAPAKEAEVCPADRSTWTPGTKFRSVSEHKSYKKYQDKILTVKFNDQVRCVIEAEETKDGFAYWCVELAGLADLDDNETPLTTTNQLSCLEPPRLSAPYHAKTNPPRKGDRIRTGKGRAGEITEVRATNPKYTVRWDTTGRQKDYDFVDLQILDIRRED